MVQVVHGDRVRSRLTFRFRDGSLDDETTVYTQRGTFRLLSDRHVQRGPSFPKPFDCSVSSNGDVTMRKLATAPGQPGEAPTTQHLDLPPDLANGLVLAILVNLRPSTPETRLSFYAPFGKGRIVHLSITPGEATPFSLAGTPRKAIDYRLHVDLGGVAAVVAPLIGKQPSDWHVWVLDGEAPAIVKIEAPLYEGGPLWRIELTNPVWPATN